MLTEEDQTANLIKEPGEGLEGAPVVEAVYDMMVVAMHVDASRVFTYRLPLDSFYAEIDATALTKKIVVSAVGVVHCCVLGVLFIVSLVG